MSTAIEAFRLPGGSGAARAGILALGVVALGAGLGILTVMSRGTGAGAPAPSPAGNVVELPAPRPDGSVSVEAALLRRRSIREYRAGALRLDELAQLLWAAQGVSDLASGGRTAPSAGALYPLEVSVLAAQVEGVDPGFYRYRPATHTLASVAPGDGRPQLSEATPGQTSVRDAPAVIVIAGVSNRTMVKYGNRGIRYVQMEAGHAAQNVYLQAAALDLGTVVVGAFDDEAVRRIARLADGEQPLYLMPVGRR